MGIKFANNATSLSAGPIIATDTSVTITPADASLFPTLGMGDYVYITLEDRRVVPNLREIVKCTARSANVLTVVRAQDDTTAQEFFLGAVVSARLCRAAILALGGEETAARIAADEAETAARIANDDTERAARLEVDTALQDQRDADVEYFIASIAAGDATETAARIAADAVEAAARALVDAALQAQRDGDIVYIDAQDDAEAAARLTDVTNLQTALTAEANARIAADAAETARALAAEASIAISTALPPGISEQSGTSASDGSGNFTVTFPVPFATNVLTFDVTGPGSCSAASVAATLTLVTGELWKDIGLVLSGSLALSQSFTWRATGY